MFRNYDEEYQEMTKRFDNEVAVVCTVLAVTLFVLGFYLLNKIKNNFPLLYKEYRCTFWSALVALTFPLLFRGVTDFAFHFFWKWPDDALD